MNVFAFAEVTGLGLVLWLSGHDGRLLPTEVAHRRQPPDHQHYCVSDHVTELSSLKILPTVFAKFPVLPEMLG